MVHALYLKIMGWINDHSFNPVDGTAAGVGVMAFLKFLPELSAGLSALWVLLRIIVLIRDEFLNKEKRNGDE